VLRVPAFLQTGSYSPAVIFSAANANRTRVARLRNKAVATGHLLNKRVCHEVFAHDRLGVFGVGSFSHSVEPQRQRHSRDFAASELGSGRLGPDPHRGPGPLTDFTGRDIQRAAQIAAEEINAASGILGRQVQIFSGDSEGVPEKAIQAFQQLAVRDQVHAIVGGFRSGAVLAWCPNVARFRHRSSSRVQPARTS